MNRRLFASRLAEKTGHPATTVTAILEAAIAALADERTTTGRFEWRGLGTFAVRTYPARKIHNPATGQTITLSPRKSVAFKPSARLRTNLKPPAGPVARRTRRGVLVRKTTRSPSRSGT